MRALRRRSIIHGIIAALVVVVTGQPAASGETMQLAIKGYDPVAYFTAGAPVRGLPEIELEWDELRYRFASIAHRDLFRADPARYAPQFTNFCAMALAKGMVLEADPEYWLVSAGRLYLFARETGPALFQLDAARHRDSANGNRTLLQR